LSQRRQNCPPRCTRDRQGAFGVAQDQKCLGCGDWGVRIPGSARFARAPGSTATAPQCCHRRREWHGRVNNITSIGLGLVVLPHAQTMPRALRHALCCVPDTQDVPRETCEVSRRGHPRQSDQQKPTCSWKKSLPRRGARGATALSPAAQCHAFQLDPGVPSRDSVG